MLSSSHSGAKKDQPLQQCFRVPGYARFFIGLIISAFGRYVQIIALSWVVYDITASAIWIGVIVFCSQGATIFFSPWAGTVIDRYDRRRILIASQLLACVQAFSLALLMSLGSLQPAYLAALATLGGIAHALDGPARQTFVLDLVPDKALFPHIVALNSLVFQGARFLAPVAGGAAVGILGANVCFWASGATALIFSGILLSIGLRTATQPSAASSSFWHAISYLRQEKETRLVIVKLAFLSLSCASSITLLPALARPDIQYAGIIDLGLMLSAVGLGNLLGTLSFLIFKKPDLQKMLVIGWAACAMSSFVLLSSTHWVIYPAVALMGYGLVLANITSNSLVQLKIDGAYRGRVLALYNSALFGSEAIGGLVAGVAYEWRPESPFAFALAASLILLALTRRWAPSQ